MTVYDQLYGPNNPILVCSGGVYYICAWNDNDVLWCLKGMVKVWLGLGTTTPVKVRKTSWLRLKLPPLSSWLHWQSGPINWKVNKRVYDCRDASSDAVRHFFSIVALRKTKQKYRIVLPTTHRHPIQTHPDIDLLSSLQWDKKSSGQIKRKWFCFSVDAAAEENIMAHRRVSIRLCFQTHTFKCARAHTHAGTHTSL